MQITTCLPCKESPTLQKNGIQNVGRLMKCGMDGNEGKQWSCSIVLKSIVLVSHSHYLLLIKWLILLGNEGGMWYVHVKYLISKPESPNNSNSMFISSLLLQSSQFPSRLWCIWKGDTEKLREEEVTASSQWCKEERKKLVTTNSKHKSVSQLPRLHQQNHVSSKKQRKKKSEKSAV